MKFKVIKLDKMVGKTVQEVKDYLEKKYPGQLAREEHREEFIKTYNLKTEDWMWYYFFGSQYRNTDGYWLVPIVHWGGARFERDGDWLGSGWNAHGRVILISEKLNVESDSLSTDPLNLRIKKLEVDMEKIKNLFK